MPDLTCKNLDLWNALVSGKPDVPGPLAELVALDTPLPASNLLRRSLRLAQTAFADLEGDRAKLIATHKAVDEEGHDIPTPDGGVLLRDPNGFAADIAVLMDVEVTLPGCVPVPVSALGNVKFSGAKLNLISAFVTEA